MAPAVEIPDAPRNLPADAAKRWKDSYAKALAQAKLNTPDNERAQRIAALKEANKMLAVPAPDSAAAIDALEDWQVIRRETVEGKRVCVTADGRKYSFPVEEKLAPATVDLTKLTKDQLVAHAAENHNLTLDPATKKDEMVAAIQAAAAK